MIPLSIALYCLELASTTKALHRRINSVECTLEGLHASSLETAGPEHHLPKHQAFFHPSIPTGGPSTIQTQTHAQKENIA